MTPPWTWPCLSATCSQPSHVRSASRPAASPTSLLGVSIRQRPKKNKKKTLQTVACLPTFRAILAAVRSSLRRVALSSSPSARGSRSLAERALRIAANLGARGHRENSKNAYLKKKKGIARVKYSSNWQRSRRRLRGSSLHAGDHPQLARRVSPASRAGCAPLGRWMSASTSSWHPFERKSRSGCTPASLSVRASLDRVAASSLVQGPHGLGAHSDVAVGCLGKTGPAIPHRSRQSKRTPAYDPSDVFATNRAFRTVFPAPGPAPVEPSGTQPYPGLPTSCSSVVEER